MDRAQRRLATSEAIFARAHALREQAATSALPQEAQLAALDRQSGQLADAERTQAGYRRLRDRYDPGELERSLQAIAAIPDPLRQRESLTQLQASYAGFAFNPEIAQRLDRQFAEFEPVVQRGEGAALLAAIKAGRYAPTLSDARLIFPGRKINTMMAPARTGLSSFPAQDAVGLATIGNFADPPRGNLHEIGTGFGIARTAAGQALGVDVNNPRFGVASDLLPFAAAIVAKPRTFTRNDVKAALERLDKKGLSASDMQGYIDPDHVIRLAEQMLSGEFRNTLMTSPVIRKGRLQVAGHHRQVAAEMANFPLEVKALPPSSSARGQAWGNLPLQPGRRK